MARPSLAYTPTQVVLQASPLLVSYLDALKKKQMYGNSRPAVATTLCWRMIEDLIRGGILVEIHEEAGEEGGDDARES
jgi:hypothetical protein